MAIQMHTYVKSAMRNAYTLAIGLCACAPGPIGFGEGEGSETGDASSIDECTEDVGLSFDNLGRLWTSSDAWDGQLQSIGPTDVPADIYLDFADSDWSCWDQDGTALEICVVSLLPCHILIGRDLYDMNSLGYEIYGDDECPQSSVWGSTYRDQFGQCWAQFDRGTESILIRVR